MLPVTTSTLKKISKGQKNEDTNKVEKNYQVSNGSVLVASDLTAVKVSSFSPLDNGHYIFDTDGITTEDFDIQTYFMGIEDYKKVIDISSSLLNHIINMLSAWLKNVSKDDKEILYLKMSFSPDEDKQATYFCLQGKGLDGVLCNFEFHLNINRLYPKLHMSINANQLLLFLLPFQKIKGGEEPVDILLHFKAEEDSYDDNLYMTVAYNGHNISSVYVPTRKKME
jgi:hypothetical protein